MRTQVARLLAIGLGLALALASPHEALAQQNPVTAIDIALEPDATMVVRAMDANERLLKAFPDGFALHAGQELPAIRHEKLDDLRDVLGGRCDPSVCVIGRGAWELLPRCARCASSEAADVCEHGRKRRQRCANPPERRRQEPAGVDDFVGSSCAIYRHG